MLEIKLTDEEVNLRRSYRRKCTSKNLCAVTYEEREAWNKYKRIQARNLDPKLFFIRRWRGNATKRNLEWSISNSYLMDLMENTIYCPFMGMVLSYEFTEASEIGSRTNPARASLDRIDNSKGYSEDNVRIVSWAYNLLKGTLTDEQVLSYCKAIVKNSENKNDGIFG